MSDIDDLRAKIADLDVQADDRAARVTYHLSEFRGGLSLLARVIDNPNSTPADINAAQQHLVELEEILTEMRKIVPSPPDLPPQAKPK